jgi:hypothetical protein
MTLSDLKTLVEILSSFLTAVGILIAAIVALFRWGPGAGPRLLIRELTFIPPGTQADIKSSDVVIAVDAIFANPTSTTEYVTNVSLTITDPKGAICKYSPFIFAKPDAFFDKSQTPKWVQSLFHPLMIQGSDKDQQTSETSKNIVFFVDSGNHFSAMNGKYKMNFTINRYSILPWRRKAVNELVFTMDDQMLKNLTSSTDPQKVALLDWHFKE